MWGLGVAKCRLGGTARSLRASATLTSPAMPAAASRCPKLLFTDPTRHGPPPSGRPDPRTAPSARASMESPSKVPVPWASTYRTHAGDTPASRYASRSTASWDSRLGAMSPLVRPSWWTALPRITEDRVPVRERLGERLQDHEPGSLAAHVPVGARVEHLAAPVRCQH